MSYRRFKGNVRPEYLRLKDAMVTFSMGPEKIEALAKECGAYFKVDRVVLIHTDTMREYIESFRENYTQEAKAVRKIGSRAIVNVQKLNEYIEDMYS